MIPTQTLTDHLNWLFARQRFGIHPGLTRIKALLDKLGNPQNQFETVLIAGTNGKGSTAATLSSILHADGRRVGLFTSPHLTHFAERFVVDGQELPESGVAEALARVRPLAEEVEASFFEIVTALGCLLFAEARVQIAVMEVGLGGRLDSTNALEPVLSLVTNIGLDHTAILGNTLEAIAREKAGILRPGRPAVTGVDMALLPIFQVQGADLWALGWHFGMNIRSLDWNGSEVAVSLAGKSLHFRTPLLGAHGAGNAALAAVAAARLGVGLEAIQAGAARTVWPGRLEVLPFGSGKIVLDGAHNPDGARALALALHDLGLTRVPLLFGAAEDKDIGGVIAELLPIASRVILTRAVLSPRAANPEKLAGYFAGVPVTLIQTPQQALAAVQNEELTIACGSLYLLGELRPLVLGQSGEVRERWQ